MTMGRLASQMVVTALARVEREALRKHPRATEIGAEGIRRFKFRGVQEGGRWFDIMRVTRASVIGALCKLNPL